MALLKICEVCKKEFKGYGNETKKSNSAYRFCSRDCYWESMRMHKKFNCKTCGIEFKPKSNGKTYKYCSKCLDRKKLGSMVGKTNIGKKSWNRGKPAPWARYELLQTPEAREKARLAKIGKPSPLKGTVRPNLRGENNWNWKGGTGTERHQAMGKIEYKLWRDSVFKRDNYICVMCKSESGYLHADHIKSWSDFPELRYAIDNGRTLCEACHYFVTFNKEIPKGIKWGRLKEVSKDVS